jgi:acetyl-CoA carboxylase biotin carboxyl carrier protein
MEPIDQDDVIEILRVLNESDFDELHLKIGDLSLVVSKRGGDAKLVQNSGVGREEPDTLVDHEKSTTSIAPQDLESPKPVFSESNLQAAKPVAPPEESGLTIKAPMLGTFYRAPKPGAPPFVEVGQVVNEDDTVCLLEVMKCFNRVRAGVRGRIAKICIEDSQMVEYQQTLFVLEEIADGKNPQENHTN